MIFEPEAAAPRSDNCPAPPGSAATKREVAVPLAERLRRHRAATLELIELLKAEARAKVGEGGDEMKFDTSLAEAQLDLLDEPSSALTPDPSHAVIVDRIETTSRSIDFLAESAGVAAAPKAQSGTPRRHGDPASPDAGGIEGLSPPFVDGEEASSSPSSAKLGLPARPRARRAIDTMKALIQAKGGGSPGAGEGATTASAGGGRQTSLKVAAAVGGMSNRKTSSMLRLAEVEAAEESDEEDETGDEEAPTWRIGLRRAFLPEQLLAWDYLMCGLILFYSCFYDTYIKTFAYSKDRPPWWETAADVIFVVDMAVSAQTAYSIQGYIMVTNRRRVLKNYLRSWFVVDFVSTVPWDIVVLHVNRQYYQHSPREALLQVLSLIRVLRILRAPRIIARITVDWQIHTVKLSFVIYAIFTLLVAHLLGCLFFLCPVIFPVGGQRARDRGDKSRESWREVNKINNMLPQRQYLHSLYWAITTMTTLGYGDIVPRLEAEMTLAIFAEIAGATAFSLLVLHIQKLYDVLIQEDGSSVQQRNDLSMYLDQMHVNKHLKSKVMRYLSYKAHTYTYSSFNDEDPRFMGLNESLKLELRVEVFAPILRRNPIFNLVPAAALAAIARLIHSRPCSPGEVVVERGTYGASCIILLTGRLKILDGAGADFKVLRASDANNVVAITSLLDDEIHASLNSLTHSLTIEAVDHCSIGTLDRDEFRRGVLPVWDQGDKKLLQVLAQHTGMDSMDTLQTIWVGAIPEAHCNEAWLRDLFGRFGGIAAVSCRHKPDATGKFKSWALISFWREHSAHAAAEFSDLDVGDGIVLKVKLDADPTKSQALALLQSQRKRRHRRRPTPGPSHCGTTTPDHVEAGAAAAASSSSSSSSSSDHYHHHPDDDDSSP